MFLLQSAGKLAASAKRGKTTIGLFCSWLAELKTSLLWLARVCCMNQCTTELRKYKTTANTNNYFRQSSRKRSMVITLLWYNLPNEYINNSLHLARKYARTFVRGHYLFREANSFPRAKLEENCELRGTDNVQGQISEHIFEAKSRLL